MIETRFDEIRDLAAKLPQLLAQQKYQPKYDPRKVCIKENGGRVRFESCGIPVDDNVVLRTSIKNTRERQAAGVVVEQLASKFIPQCVDGLCRLATDEEILAAYQGQLEFAATADANERENGFGRYNKNPDAVPPKIPAPSYLRHATEIKERGL